MEAYIEDILSVVQRLADMGETIENKWISFVMRNGVSQDYENFVAAVNQQLQEQARSEDVKVALLGESDRRRVKDESSSTTALVSKQLKKTQRKQKKQLNVMSVVILTTKNQTVLN